MDNTKEGKSEKFFKEFGKRVDLFIKELNEASTRAQGEFKDRFEDLKSSAERLKNEMEDKDRWKEVEESLKRAGKELENAFASAFKKKDEKK